MRDRIDPPASGLLARKGQARPAMRPVNDNDGRIAAAFSASGGPVAATGLSAFGVEQPGRLAAAAALARGRKAAVMLRLDPARHLRLRLACALGERSAQAIIAEALDEYLDGIEGLDRLMAEALADDGGQAVAGWGQE